MGIGIKPGRQAMMLAFAKEWLKENVPLIDRDG
jgi:hypothetical protein